MAVGSLASRKWANPTVLAFVSREWAVVSVLLSHFLEPFLGVILTAAGGDASLRGWEHGCSPSELSTYCVLGVVRANPGGQAGREPGDVR